MAENKLLNDIFRDDEGREQTRRQCLALLRRQQLIGECLTDESDEELKKSTGDESRRLAECRQKLLDEIFCERQHLEEIRRESLAANNSAAESRRRLLNDILIDSAEKEAVRELCLSEMSTEQTPLCDPFKEEIRQRSRQHLRAIRKKRLMMTCISIAACLAFSLFLGRRVLEQPQPPEKKEAAQPKAAPSWFISGAKALEHVNVSGHLEKISIESDDSLKLNVHGELERISDQQLEQLQRQLQ